MKDLITIGLPSKGRLKDKSISFFNDRGLKILQSEKQRNSNLTPRGGIRIVICIYNFLVTDLEFGAQIKMAEC